MEAYTEYFCQSTETKENLIMCFEQNKTEYLYFYSLHLNLIAS